MAAAAPTPTPTPTPPLPLRLRPVVVALLVASAALAVAVAQPLTNNTKQKLRRHPAAAEATAACGSTVVLYCCVCSGVHWKLRPAARALSQHIAALRRQLERCIHICYSMYFCCRYSAYYSDGVRSHVVHGRYAVPLRCLSLCCQSKAVYSLLKSKQLLIDNINIDVLFICSLSALQRPASSRVRALRLLRRPGSIEWTCVLSDRS